MEGESGLRAPILPMDATLKFNYIFIVSQMMKATASIILMHWTIRFSRNSMSVYFTTSAWNVLTLICAWSANRKGCTASTSWCVFRIPKSTWPKFGSRKVARKRVAHTPTIHHSTRCPGTTRRVCARLSEHCELLGEEHRLHQNSLGVRCECQLCTLGPISIMLLPYWSALSLHVFHLALIFYVWFVPTAHCMRSRIVPAMASDVKKGFAEVCYSAFESGTSVWDGVRNLNILTESIR